MKPVLGVVGAGKVGSVLARLWRRAGYRVGAVYSRTASRSLCLAEAVGAVTAASPHDVVRLADLTMLSIPDDAIRLVVDQLSCDDWSDKAVIHTSGVYDRQVLDSLSAQGAMTGSFHPVFPFADVDTSLLAFSGATIAVEAENEQLRGWLHDLVEAVEGQLIELPPGSKALYHAALVIASNYTVTLYAIAEQLLTGFGAERAVVDNALNTLIAATLENIRREGIPWALTGPLARADSGTIRMHLDAFERGGNHRLADVYRGLARLSLSMLEARGISDGEIQKLERVLIQDNGRHAIDDT